MQLPPSKKSPHPTPDLLSLLGILQDDTGQFPAAEQTYRAALAHAPDRADLHNNLGYNLLLQAKPVEAAAELQAALKIDPRSPRPTTIWPSRYWPNGKTTPSPPKPCCTGNR